MNKNETFGNDLNDLIDLVVILTIQPYPFSISTY